MSAHQANDRPGGLSYHNAQVTQSRGRWGIGDKWQLKCWFAYKVADVWYAYKHVQVFGSEADAERRADAWREKGCELRYDPAAPENCCLCE